MSVLWFISQRFWFNSSVWGPSISNFKKCLRWFRWGSMVQYSKIAVEKAYSRDRSILAVFTLKFPPTPRRLTHWHCLGKSLWITQNFSIERHTLPLLSSNFYSIHTQVHFIQPLDMWGLASVMLLNSKSHNSTKLHVFSQSRLDYIIIKITIIFTVLWIRCRPWFSFLFSFHIILSKLYFFQKWALKAIFSPITDLFFSQYQTLSPLFCKDEA